ncbi:translocation/assembly module TamB domain-containing protein [Nitrosomonas sp. Is24]|uniref:translocation/assembly module TamB domain-containing protein n=1 Tax=Nitrosomonas sp. Is24 TaxID=3080533 RepID=UPI00294AD699|nr:translocation/assembly module TamB domain-containing protein [Nitrosomonas sp. Is24]MDV6340530.1 translocation/assembly module TamB domain-containing protein [Nitrosomonas sp. Is24]
MSEQNTINPPSPKTARRYHTLAGSLLLWLVLTVIAGYWLLYSSSGLQSTATAVNRWSGGTVQLNGVHGTLQDLHIENIHFDNGELALTLQNLHMHWNPGQLLQRRVSINRLALESIWINQHTTETTPAAPQPPDSLLLPFGLSIAELTAASIHLNAASQENAAPVISNLVLALDSDGKHHRFTQLNFTTPWATVESQAELAGNAPYALSARIGITADGSWGGIDTTVTGNLEQLTIQSASRPPAAHMTLQAQVQPFAANPLTQLHAILEQWNPADFLANAPQAQLSLSAQLMQNEAGQLAGNINIENHATAPFDQDGIPLSAIRSRVQISPQSLTLPDLHAQSGKDGVVRGALVWDWRKHALTADLAVERLDPQQLDSRLQTAAVSGKIELSGGTEKQSARIDLRDRSLRLTANIARTPEQLVLEQFIVQRNRSRLAGQGKLQLTGDQSFELSGELIDFNSADFIQAVDSSLNATLQLSGQRLPAVTGTLKYAMQKSRLAKSPVSGSGEIAFTGAGRFSGKAELLAGSNRLLAQGRLDGERHDVQLTVNAPALAQLGLGVSGDLQTQLSFRGTLKTPDLDWKLTSKHLELPGKQQFSGLSASARWQQDDTIALNVAADTYRAHEQATIRQLLATLDGKTGHHRLMVNAAINRDVAVRLAANGGLSKAKPGQPPRWQGQLTGLSATGDMPFRLLAPATLAASTTSFLLHDAGFSLSGGSVRIEQLHWTPDSLKTSGDFTGIGLLPGAPVRAKEAPLQLGGRWYLDNATQLSGELHIQRERGDWYLPGDIPQPLGLQQLQLQATARQGKLSGQFTLNSETLGSVRAEVAMPLQPTKAQWSMVKESPLQGDIQASIASLKWLNAFGDNLHADGELHIQAGIRGTLQQPDISGTVSGANLRLALLEQGIRLQQGTLTAHFQQADLHIDRLHFASPHGPPPDNRLFGNLALQDTAGSLTVSGKAGLTGGPSHLDFSIEKLPLAHKTDYWIVSSGSGTARLQQNRLSIAGDLRADAGLIMQPPEDRPSLPDDVVLVNTSAPQRAQKLALDLAMNFNLGEKFHIRAAGLEGRLAGQLQVRNDNNQQLKLTGVIAAQDTAFKAYGQNLTVKRGIVSFQGPLDDPNLSVLAVREGLAVEAGVEIDGSVRHPRVRLVSTPEVPDLEKLSWIVLGRKPDASGLDTSVLLSAAGSILGGQSGSGITDRITQALGVDEITFKQASFGSSLTGQIGVIGKRISSRAYLTYERGLTATTVGIAKLNYSLTPRITIVTQAGEDSAVDLFYSMQFD